MLSRDTLAFLTDLKAKNNKPWFDANRSRFDTAREDYAQLVAKVLSDLASADAVFSDLTTKDCTFRINRDIRFSKDKTPYKTNFGAGFNAGGKKAQNAGYYLHVEPGKSFIGGGFWMPAAPELSKIRQEIDYNLVDFKRILSKKKFREFFINGLDSYDKLQRPPKGYEVTNPAIEWLKLKSFTVMSPVADEVLLSAGFQKYINSVFKTLHPFVDFLNQAIV